ncbi:MAG: O-methyltransferase [Microthrixaceae bacterium]|nr:O-methyltransferase [Microthrixaceae bacterium]
MAGKGFEFTDELRGYVMAHSANRGETTEEAQARAWLIERTHEALADVAGMQIAPEQGPLLTMFAQLVDARLIVEVGTFTGLSALCLAQGLAPGGRVICHDRSEEWTAIAREGWRRAGLEDRVELRIGPASETLRELPDEPIDLAFLDADKGGYIGYHEEVVPRLRPGGLLVVDNVLWSGRVVDAAADDAGAGDSNTVAIRAYNDHAAADPRVDVTIVNVGDGLLLARKR